MPSRIMNMNGSQSSDVKFAGSADSLGEKKKWWSFRQVQVLILVLVVCAIVSVALIIALAVVSSEDSGSPAAQTGQETCTSTECVVAAARVAQSIDFSVDPCQDFYTYACGTWMEKNVIPDDRSETNTFGVLRDEVEVILKNLLEENETAPGEEVLQKAKDLYRSCLDLDKLEERGDQPLKDFIINVLGGWPLMEDGTWSEASFNVTDMLGKLTLYNNDPLVYVYVGTDLKNSSARILYMDQPGFGLPGRRYYLVERNDSNLVAYETLIRSVAQQLQSQATDLDQQITDLVNFEIHLANISVPDEDRRDSEALYNKYTLPELSLNFTGDINWQTLLNTIYTQTDINIPLAADEPIINRSPPYFTKLLETLQTTPKKTLANFLVWRIVMNRISQLNAVYRGFVTEYNKVVYGTATERARFRTCASYTVSNLGLGVGNMFVKKAFDEEAKDVALDMIKELKAAFNQLLDELEWMDDSTKDVAREKNEYIDEKIGYPDEVLNITHLTKLYENYTYNTELYFENVLTNIQEAARNNYRQLREPVDRDQWTSAPSTVNAFYSSLRNQIMFPAGILQPPFFSKTYPKSLNFGGIGVVIGHEITHGFDDRGRQYDKYGNLEQWWSDSAIERFKGRAQCIINQYGNFTVPEADMNLNGIQTQGENIADNGGLRQSFRAYRNWIRHARGGVEEPLLPGLDFTNNQLFFINFAQIWCTNMRRESAVNRILTGVHSPGRFRVIGTLQNSADFADAFQCKKDDYMHPSNKCVVW